MHHGCPFGYFSVNGFSSIDIKYPWTLQPRKEKAIDVISVLLTFVDKLVCCLTILKISLIINFTGTVIEW